MFFQTIFVSLVLLALGAAVWAAGFRLFVLILPVFGFLAGFVVTAQAIQQLVGGGFLATTSSWVFGFFVGLIGAVVAYLFYYGAIAILAATVGYEIGVGILAGLGISSGFVQFIIGLVVALAFAAGVIAFNLPRLLIVVLTSLIGAGMILSGILVGLGRISLGALQYGVVGAFIRLSWFWSLVFLALAAAGIVVQLLVLPTRLTLQPYDEEEYAQRTRTDEPTLGAPSAQDDASGGVPPAGAPAA